MSLPPSLEMVYLVVAFGKMAILLMSCRAAICDLGRCRSCGSVLRGKTEAERRNSGSMLLSPIESALLMVGIGIARHARWRTPRKRGGCAAAPAPRPPWRAPAGSRCQSGRFDQRNERSIARIAGVILLRRKRLCRARLIGVQRKRVRKRGIVERQQLGEWRGSSALVADPRLRLCVSSARTRSTAHVINRRAEDAGR